MPTVGLGTFSISDPEHILTALKSGYKLIDTASFYKNEDVVGKAIQ